MNATRAAWKALVIDDDADFRSLLRAYLGDSYRTVLEAKEGRDGFLLAQSHRPDVVLLDLAMPGQSGEEVLRQLRAHPETEDVPVIVVTGLDPSPNLAGWFAAQGVELVRKDGLTREAILEVVARQRRVGTRGTNERDVDRHWLRTPAIVLFRELLD